MTEEFDNGSYTWQMQISRSFVPLCGAHKLLLNKTNYVFLTTTQHATIQYTSHTHMHHMHVHILICVYTHKHNTHIQHTETYNYIHTTYILTILKMYGSVLSIKPYDIVSSTLEDITIACISYCDSRNTSSSWIR